MSLKDKDAGAAVPPALTTVRHVRASTSSPTKDASTALDAAGAAIRATGNKKAVKVLEAATTASSALKLARTAKQELQTRMAEVERRRVEGKASAVGMAAASTAPTGFVADEHPLGGRSIANVCLSSGGE